MKTLTIRLVQFTISALVLTVVFRYTLNLFIGVHSVIGTISCSIVYACLMFIIGWHFGKKDVIENDNHDVGFRLHIVTYLLSNGIGYGAYYLGWNTETLCAMTITLIFWGICLIIHFIYFLIEQKKTINGYARDEIFP